MDCEAPLPLFLPLGSTVLVIANHNISENTTRAMTHPVTELERKSRFRKHAEYGFVLAYLHGTCPRGCQLMFTPAPVASGIGDVILFVGPKHHADEA
jgi:hypothetical protein